MKKSSITSFGIYVLYILYGIYWIFVYFNNVANPPSAYPEMRMEHIVGGALILIGLVLLGIKALHIRTGLGIFSIICALLDAFGVFLIWRILVLDAVSLGTWLAELDAEGLSRSMPFIVLSLVPAIACISNLISTPRK